MVNPGATAAEPVHIVCAADAGYAIPLCVMLVSVMIHLARDRCVEIYILAPGIADEDRRKIEASLCANRPGFAAQSVHWLTPDAELTRDLPVSKHVTREAYSRLLAPLVLPAECSRALYLDADMVVTADVSELYDLPCEDRVLRAARDMDVGMVGAPGGVFNFAELGIAPAAPYFNSGVLLINLRRWREQDATARILDYLMTHKDLVMFWDQGGLNAILHDAWDEIDPAWNQTRAIFRPAKWEPLGYRLTDWRRVKNHPKIVHFTGPFKPWKANVRRPGYTAFFNVLGKTEYRDAFRSPMLERIIGFRLYCFLWMSRRIRYPLFRGR